MRGVSHRWVACLNALQSFSTDQWRSTCKSITFCPGRVCLSCHKSERRQPATFRSISDPASQNKNDRTMVSFIRQRPSVACGACCRSMRFSVRYFIKVDFPEPNFPEIQNCFCSPFIQSTKESQGGFVRFGGSQIHSYGQHIFVPSFQIGHASRGYRGSTRALDCACLYYCLQTQCRCRRIGCRRVVHYNSGLRY